MTAVELHHHRGHDPPSGSRNGSYRHGRFTLEMLEERQLVWELLRRARELVGSM
jgi:hypothetical protein